MATKKKSKKKKSNLNMTFIAGMILIGVVLLIWTFEQFGEAKDKKPGATSNENSISRETERVDEIDNETEEANEEDKDEAQKEAENENDAATDETDKEEIEELEVEEPIIVNKGVGNFDLEVDLDSLSTTVIGWSFKRNTENKPVVGYNQGIDLEKYDAFYIGNTEDKVVYLTFDEGYEYGYTPMILDALKKYSVQASFFVTRHFIDSEPELCKRMVEEGHIVGNHSNTHPSLPTLTDEQIVWELESTEEAFEKATGYKMDLFVRPPRAEFSERSLYISRLAGYRNVFYSMAYQDWLVDAQPGKDVALAHVLDNVHPGAVILLHAVSQSNAEAMEDIVKNLLDQGYRFGSLYEISSNY